jgi:hypothetical protein
MEDLIWDRDVVIIAWECVRARELGVEIEPPHAREKKVNIEETKR